MLNLKHSESTSRNSVLCSCPISVAVCQHHLPKYLATQCKDQTKAESITLSQRQGSIYQTDVSWHKGGSRQKQGRGCKKPASRHVLSQISSSTTTSLQMSSLITDWHTWYCQFLLSGRVVSTMPPTLSILQCKRPAAMNRDSSLAASSVTHHTLSDYHKPNRHCPYTGHLSTAKIRNLQ